MDTAISRRTFIVGAAAVGAGVALLHGAEAQAPQHAAGRLITRIDCTEDLPPERYFGHGSVQVVESAAGRYREAEGAPLSRFGYRFSIENTGKPHVAVVRYPDDKRRYMCINDGTCYDLTTGVFTGFAQPLSMQMLELEQVFWPRWNDCSIVFMTWSTGEPAAAASIEIYELDNLAPLDVPGDSGDGSRRVIGIQYEDPCGVGGAEGTSDHEDWTEHVVQYARHSGQSLLVYPMAWYHGPRFPCECEPADEFNIYVAPDRKQYSRWTTRSVDWYARLLERFDQEGLRFCGALTLMRLGSLLQNMNIDEAAIQAGAETYNNMLWNNSVQSSTMDWTGLYNARNFNGIAGQVRANGTPTPLYGTPFEMAYGERHNPASRMGPMFNPVHPAVQEAILRFAGEIGGRYGKYRAFTGISFNMFASCMPWFGSIKAGYDDYTVQRFQEETGIYVPVDPKAPDRFRQRYDFLTGTCREAWLDWRCTRIRGLFGRIHERLAEARPDLEVTVTLWDETTVPGVLGAPNASTQIHARASMYEFFREAGIDLQMYGDDPRLRVDRGMGNSRDRGGHGANPCGGVTLPPDQVCMYRDFDFLDSEAIAAHAGHPRPGAFIFNCWVEAWGEHVWFSPEPDDPNLAAASVMDGQPAEGVMRMNSVYPPDGFWWDSQLRITPGFPSSPHFLEPYAQAVADMDACRITRGGLFLDKAHTRELQAFARAYRALPDRKFETIGDSTDPVAVRTLLHDGKRYVYAVNREYYPVNVTLRFDNAPAELRDAAKGVAMDAAGSAALSVPLQAYELRVFTLAPTAAPTGFDVEAPLPIIDDLAAQAAAALAAIDTVRASGGAIPGMDAVASEMRAAVEEKRWAMLRRLLTSYVVRAAHARATA